MTPKKTLDINRQKIDEPIEIDSETETAMPRSFDWKQASITLVLLIIALWSAYLVTQLLNGKSFFASLTNSKKTESTADKTTTDTTPPATAKETNKTATDATKTADPFAPIKNDTKTTTTTSTTTDTVAVAKDSFQIRLLNGNGIVGDAANLKKDLTDKGFKVGTVGNANLKYTKTQVYYKAGKQKEADLVNKELTSRQTEVKEADSGLIGDGYDVLIVTGKS